MVQCSEQFENVQHKEEAMREIALKPGDPAPDFTLKNQYDQPVSLQGLRGKNVLLAFHPLAWTGVCEIQMRGLELKQKVFDELSTVALGISVDSVPCKKAWADSMRLEGTQLLADFWPHGEVAKKYDLFIEKAGISGRANVLVDAEGKIAKAWVYEILQIPDIEAVIAFIKGGRS
jgi:peroxiredoxin